MFTVNVGILSHFGEILFESKGHVSLGLEEVQAKNTSEILIT